ncbi:acyltransferase family protein [Agreia pratensis]|uniref:Peptidoglycan/LPS O-acetylase OafA/YrhL, contains acyltransferase and SGNH-hydrolase domains n=1 Tax=Agreia pratensis TaxID=150121 RepID=A0A1X7INC4_9MICO|nr:acyltransferase family protein [Agreia pratensis]SMG16197.1 Peptidoglycan/LPS O-acetylase OafA/YrhL, contains acyltransferase and SGNH-hydrolase domains [Agreia pratensis]
MTRTRKYAKTARAEPAGVKAASPPPPRADIQGLRALAVVAVILDHLLGWPAGGFVGVDVFFVISGFLITGLLLREHQRTGSISFIGFYRRRIKRIMPAAVAVVVVTIFAASILFGKSRLLETIGDGIWATFFAANWHFAAAGTDYFQLGGPISPLQHYWSLAVEEQFYFVWPWLMLLIFWAVARRGRASEKTARVAVGLTVVAISLASFTWAIFETINNPTWAYFSTFSRAWELGIGAIVALTAGHLARIPAWLRPALGWIGLAGVMAAVFVVSDTDAFPAPWAALPVLATALVIAAGTGGTQRFLWPIMNRATNYIGDISYSLYLWHFPILIMLLTLMPGSSLEYYVVALALTGALSVVSYHLIEDPVRKSRWLDGAGTPKAPRRPVDRKLATGWLAVLATVSILLVVVAFQRQPVSVPRIDTAELLSAYDPDAAAEPAASLPLCLGAATLDPAASCTPVVVGSQLAPLPADVAEDTGNSYACFPNEDQAMKVCHYGDVDSDVRVAIVGDSHAASLIPGLSQEASGQGWALDTYVGAACIWISGSCEAMPDIEKALLEQPYDIVITSAYRGSGNTDKDALAQSFADTWTPVATAGSKIVVIEDVPISAGEAVACVTRVNFVATDDCSISTEKGYRVQDGAAMAVPLVQNAALVSTQQYFCQETCPEVIGNVLVYRDDISHITATYSKTLAPYLVRDIVAATSPAAPE